MPPAARPLVRRTLAWALLADFVPLYPLYALLFVDAGLSAAEVSALLAIWSGVGIVAEVPAGALADRFSRRGALAAAGVFQAAGYAVWLSAPGFQGFASGFALWGLGGALQSGAFEALLYEGLESLEAEAHYPRVLGQVTAAGLVVQGPTAGAATALFALGGYGLAGWVSVAGCLGAAALASRLPEPPRARAGDDVGEPGYAATLRAGVGEAARSPAVRGAVLAAAVIGALDTLEEYFPLLVRDWGVPTELNPLTVLGVWGAGALGALLGGRRGGTRSGGLGLLLGAAAAALAGAALLDAPLALLPLAAFYGLYRLVLVGVEARLQSEIEGPARATVTSVAGLGTDLVSLALLALWALGGVGAAAALVALAAAWLALPTRLSAPRT